jgi:hypothetical protein
MLTHADVQYWRGDDVLKGDQATMMSALEVNPRRSNGHVPKLQELPKEVWINPRIKVWSHWKYQT